MRRKHGTMEPIGGAFVLAVLCISVPFLANRLRAKVPEIFGESAVYRSTGATYESQPCYDFVASLPSYRTLDERLRELGVASSELLAAAAQEDSDSLSIAVIEFRESVRQVQSSFRQLSDRIGREQAEFILEDGTLASLDMDGYWRPEELLFAEPHE